MINSDDLKYFLELTKTGHFTRASERLGISQPALSHAIKKIETEVKSQLFFRSKKGVQLTPSGEILLKSVQQLIDQWSLVRDSISLNQTTPRGLIRLGCHASVAQYMLPSFLPHILQSHPELYFQLKHGLSREMTAMVVADELEAGIVVNPARHPDLIIKLLCEDEVGLWQSLHCKNRNVLIVDPSLLQTLDILNKLKQ